MKRSRNVRVVATGQAAVTAVGGAAWGTAQGGDAGLAAVSGGLIALLPALALAAIAFSVPDGAEPRRLAGAFYRGEAVKFGLTIVLFVLALQWFADQFVPLFSTYVLALLVYWPALRISLITQR